MIKPSAQQLGVIIDTHIAGGSIKADANRTKLQGRNLNGRTFVCSLAFGLLAALYPSAAAAQSSTTTTLSATPVNAVTGSIITMTATVSSGGSPVTAGTVTFNDTIGGITSNLGTAQIQSTKGTAGAAILKTEVGGVGTHSVTATFNATKTYSKSSSSGQSVTFVLPYGSATALSAKGVGGLYTLTATLSAFGPPQPGGKVTFTDTTTNTAIGTVALDPTTITSGFTPPTLYPIPSTTPWGNTSFGTPIVGDFNGDGRPDFAVPTSLGPISILLGNGDGTFQNGASPATISPFGGVVGDFNGDGKQDIAVVNTSLIVGNTSSVAVFLGNGDGTFQPAQIYGQAAAGSNANYLHVAEGDFNGDGYQDLVVTDRTNSQVIVLLGNGDGTFQAPTSFSTGSLPWNVVVGDVNNDGILDVVTADDGDNLVTVLLGNGDGTFRKGAFPVGSTTSTGSVTLADFNGDGNLDIATTEEPTNKVFVLLGNGDGTFKPLVGYPMDKGPYYLTVEDFNQDGKKDIISANSQGDSIGVLLGNGDGTFRPATIFPAGGDPLNPRQVIYATVGDFNGDHQVDVAAVTSDGLQVYLAGNAETALFTPFTVSGCSTQSIIAAYSGDSNFTPSTSSVTSLSQNGLATSISLAHNPTNISYGQSAALTATLTPYSTGSFSSDGKLVTFMDGTTMLGTGVLAKGVATLSVPSLSTGSHSLTASYSGDCNLTGSTSIALPTTVAQANPVITWPAPPSIVYGTTLSVVQLNATASVPGAFAYTPALGSTPLAGTDTLNVTFTPTDTVNYATVHQSNSIVVTQSTLAVAANDATRAYGAVNPTFTGTVTGGQNGDAFTESFTTAATPLSAPGNYAIVPAVMGTDVAQYQQTVTNGNLTVTKAGVTTTSSVSATAVQPGASVTITAAVASATSGTPTGTASFFDNGNALGTSPLTAGTAAYTTTALPIGTHAITVAYGGDSNFSASTPSGASSITVALAILKVTANNATKVYGAAIPAFSGSITGAQNGDTFAESFTTIATVLSAPATYAIVPSATGTNLSQYGESISNGTLTVTKATVVPTLSLSTPSAQPGQSVTLTANVASATSGTPTGTVTFLANGNSLGTATLANGVATYSTTALAVGANVITFTYSGDANFTSGALSASNGANTITIASLDFAMTSTGATTVTGNYGSSNTQFTFHIAPTSGQYPGPVKFSVAGSSSIATTYTFSPATLASGAGPTDVTMTVAIPTPAAADRPAGFVRRFSSIAYGLFMLPLLSVRRMRKTGEKLGKCIALSAFMLIFIGGILSLAGCGGGSHAPSVPNNPITADSLVISGSSGSVQHSLTVTLNIQKGQ